MKKTMKIHMCGPMQAYGKKPEGNYIATHHQPTKSAIVGLLGCSGGIPRNDPRLKEIYDSIEISVESYHTPIRGKQLVPMTEPPIIVDFQANSTGKKPTFTRREYICDAYFIVNLTADEDKIEQYTAWLEDPYRAPYLGRKDCIPSLPFLMDKLPYETGGDSSNENTTDQ